MNADFHCSKTFHIVIVGVGNVGKELVRQILDRKQSLNNVKSCLYMPTALLGNLDLRIIGLANSKSYWLANGE
jgi:homoserine dehydrogenase